MWLWLLLGGLGVYAVTRKTSPAPATPPAPAPGQAPSGSAGPGQPAAPQLAPGVKLSPEGAQIYVPTFLSPEEATETIRKAMEFYRLDGEPKRVTDGPFAGASALTFVVSGAGAKLEESKAIMAFFTAMGLVDNPKGEKVMLVMAHKDADELLRGKKPSPFVMFFAAESHANKLCQPGSAYVMFNAKPKL